MYQLKINLENINSRIVAAISAGAEVFKRMDEADEAARLAIDPEGGQTAQKRYQEQLAEHERQREAARAAMRATVESEKASFYAAIREQTALSGDFLASADAALLLHSLVRSAEELKEIADRNKADPAARRLVEGYAERNGWILDNGGMEFVALDNSKALEEWGGSYFTSAENAAENPLGYSGMFILNPETFTDTRRACNLL